jgi:23S rRNA pseudouridine1911/1915/1917 synthase
VKHQQQWETALRGQLYDFTAGNEVTKERLDVYLAGEIKQYSRSFLSDLCEKGRVSVNGKQQMKNYKVNKGDKVVIDIDIKHDTSTVTPEYIPLDILYEDEHIIAVNKPNGMVVHPAVGSPNGTFVNALLYHLGDSAKGLLDSLTTTADTIVDDEEEFDGGEQNPISNDGTAIDLPETPEAAQASPQRLRPGIVHRLDKGTSGVLLAAKHPEAVTKLSALFAQRNIRKVYLAVCVGHPGETSIIEPIGRCKKNRQLMTVYDGPPGKPALTHVRTLAFDGKISAALVRIETGRTHQIRVHLKERRTPIVGDEAYGSMEWNKKLLRSDGVRRPLLHAYETEFVHPFTGKTILIRAPVPADMSGVLRRLTVENEPLLDATTNLLKGTTEVEGVEAGDRRGGMKGFVPSDRLVLEDDDWTSQDLPETMDQ